MDILDDRAAIRAVIAEEQRTIRRYTWRLLFGWRASERQRVRWEAQKAWHIKQITCWKERLET